VIPPKPDIFEESDLGEDGEVIPFELSAKDMPSLMRHLTELYSRPEEAVVREYGTNARDAHQEAGVDRPIEVSCPTPLSPVFMVKDYGLGMSLEMVRNVFTKYGASTKRLSNLFTGHLGLGCKAGMCYTGQITVKTVWEDEKGVRWKLVGIISRRDDDTAGFHVAHHAETDDATGTEITVPRQKQHDFYQSVHWFYSFWQEGEVLIDGAPPKPLEGKRLGDNILLQSFDRKNYMDYHDYVVMGGVPYKLKAEHRLFNPKELDYAKAVNTVCWIKMGTVDFTPNREDLIYSDMTKEALRKLSLEVHGRIKWLLNQELDQAPGYWEALNISNQWRQEYGFTSKEAVYRGVTVPLKWKNPGICHFNRSYYHTRASYEPSHKEEVTTQYILENAHPQNVARKDGTKDPRPIVVVGAPFEVSTRNSKYENKPKTLKQGAKTQLRIYGEVEDRSRLFVMAELPDPIWWSGLETIPWAEVAKAKLPKVGEVIEGYGFEDHTGKRILVQDLPTRGVLYTDPGHGINLGPAMNLLERNRGQKYVLLQVHARRLAKFKRAVPHALPFNVIYQSEMERLAIKALSFPACHRMMIGHWDLEFLQGLDKAGAVLDPEIKKWVEVSRLPADKAAEAAIQEFRDAMHKVVYRSDLKFSATSAVHELQKNQGRPVRELLNSRYPLISKDHIPQDERSAHLLDYMNWYYGKLNSSANGNGNGASPTPTPTPTPAKEADR
jgi:hypothetical protein